MLPPNGQFRPELLHPARLRHADCAFQEDVGIRTVGVVVMVTIEDSHQLYSG